MDETKKKMMDDTKKAIIVAMAFLLCIFFFMLPIVQCTQDSSFAATGWSIATNTSEKSIDGDILLTFSDIKELIKDSKSDTEERLITDNNSATGEELITDDNPDTEEELITDSTSNTENEAIASYNRGNEYLKTGDLDLAIAEYTASLNIQPNFAKALNNRGNAYAERGDLDLAIADYTATLCINPNDIFSLHNRSKAYVRSKDYDKAIADYTTILCIDIDALLIFFPDAVLVFKYRKLLIEELVTGRNPDINEELITDSDNTPNTENKAIVLYNRGNDHLRKGDLDQAIVEYTASLNIQPDFAEALNNRDTARDQLVFMNARIAAENNLAFVKARISWVSKANFLVFVFLIIPILLIILAFINISFSLMRNISIIGIIVKIAFIIFVYTQYGNYLIPTIFCWVIFALYIVLCAFVQYCNKIVKE